LRILDNENAEIPDIVVLGATGGFCGTTASFFTGSRAVLGVTGTEVCSFFSAEGLTSVMEKVGFL
jgi:MinD-like ATPase involved in chromosome partitioning or flagellar assembly